MIPFTQYLRPNGRRRQISISRPNQIECHAFRLCAAGVVFEIEELANGAVSMEAVRERDGETEVLTGEICNNGPQVPECVDKMVMHAYTLLFNEPAPDAHPAPQTHPGTAETSPGDHPTP